MSFRWSSLPKPFSVLAPMDDVTDVVFRDIVAKHAPPDVFFTEFTNCEALFSPGRNKHIGRLRFTEQQRPIIAQIWGINPDHYRQTAELIAQMGFDGIDINMGCPDATVVKSGACSALMNNRPLAKQIIEATIKGAGNLPVSVKTRIGFKTIDTENWLSFLLQFPLAALTVHGRTVKEQSKVPNHWDEIGKAVQLRNSLQPSTIIIGNGDVVSMSEVQAKHKEFGVDGVMIGRGIFHNLWVFEPTPQTHTQHERLVVLQAHVKLYEQTWNTTKKFDVLKKFVKVYVSGYDGAAELRASLMESKSYADLHAKIDFALQTIV